MNSIIATLLFVLPQSQSDQNTLCQLPEPGIVLETKIEDSPNYFFRTFPDSDLVSYDGGPNYILNLKTGEKKSVPGNYDPVPLLNEKIITSFGATGGIRFYPIYSDRNTLESDLILIDEKGLGKYQSIGELESVKPFRKFRIIFVSDADGILGKISYSDYVVDTTRSPYKINAIKHVEDICKGMDLKLPMISKDGKFLAARDQKSVPTTTKIYEITNEKECTFREDLGIATGKVDFSFDGHKIAFHIDTLHSNDYFQNPTVKDSKNGNMNVFEMDLKTKKIKQLSFSSDGHSYFPSYRRDGKVAFIRHTPVGQENNYSFILVDPKKIHGRELEELEPVIPFKDCDEGQQKDALTALGQAWYQICAKAKVSKEQGFILGANLTKDKCIELVQNQIDSIALPTTWKFEKKDLIKLCGGMSEAKTDQRKATLRKVVSAKQDPVSILQNKCSQCHTDVPFNDLVALRALPATQTKGAKTWKQAIPIRIQSRDEVIKMPKGGSLTPEQLHTLLKYIQ